MVTLVIAAGAKAQFTKADLQATGLTCAMCSNAINKALLALPAVESVKPEIKTSSFHIVFKSTQEATIADQIRKAVEDAGFSVGSLGLTGNFSGVTVKNDEHVNVGSQVLHFVDVKDQVLDGTATVQVVDKDFLTAKKYKKIRGATKMECINTGTSSACCTSAGVAPGKRIFHVTI